MMKFAEAIESGSAIERQGCTGEEAGREDNRQRPETDQVGLLNHVADVEGPFEQIRYGAGRQDSVILDRFHLLFEVFPGRAQFHAPEGNYSRGAAYSR